MGDLLRLRDVVVQKRGRRVIGPIDLTLLDHGPTMVIGPNGSGKTSLLRVAYGIERLTSGTVDWMQDTPMGRAFVFQSPTVLRRSVADNLAYPLQILGWDKAAINDAVDDWLIKTGLERQAKTPATRLSGGERQKLAIARALIRAPQVLFLDEPCANLDGHTTREIEAILTATAQAGTKLVMATHGMGQARRLATHTVFMLDGQVHESGGADMLNGAAQTPQLTAFLQGDIVT